MAIWAFSADFLHFNESSCMVFLFTLYVEPVYKKVDGIKYIIFKNSLSTVYIHEHLYVLKCLSLPPSYLNYREGSIAY
jgi:hypothetical protein